LDVLRQSLKSRFGQLRLGPSASRKSRKRAGFATPLQQATNPGRAHGEVLCDFLSRQRSLVTSLHNPLPQILRIGSHRMILLDQNVEKRSYTESQNSTLQQF
jgi:hypothetical protein